MASMSNDDLRAIQALNIRSAGSDRLDTSSSDGERSSRSIQVPIVPRKGVTSPSMPQGNACSTDLQPRQTEANTMPAVSAARPPFESTPDPPVLQYISGNAPPEHAPQSDTPSTSLSPPSLLDLPNELVSHIILPLPVPDILRSQAVCSKLQLIIANSVEIQYRIALEVSGLEDNPECPSYSTSERLEQVLRRQEAWNKFKPQFTTPVDVPKPSRGYAELNGGVYALASGQISAVDYVKLPQSGKEKGEWKSVDLQEQCFDVGLCSGEHDLMAILTKSLVGNSGVFEIALHLRQMSTGRPHPEAKQPRMVICKTETAPCSFDINIIGNNITARLRYPIHTPRSAQIVAFEWRTGELKTSLVAPRGSYTGSNLLEENLLLIANAQRGCLEFWDLPGTASEPPPLRPVCALGLPLLVPSGSFRAIVRQGKCGLRRQNNSMGEGVNAPQQPFRPNAEEAIIAFDVTVYVDGTRSSFSFFVHRLSALQLVEDCRQRQASLPLVDDDSGFGSEPLLAPIPWEQWGEKNARWIETTTMVTRWSQRSAGSRAVFIPKRTWPFSSAESIAVVDFNPWSVKKCRHASVKQRKLAERKGEQRQKQRWEPNAEFDVSWQLLDRFEGIPSDTQAIVEGEDGSPVFPPTLQHATRKELSDPDSSEPVSSPLPVRSESSQDPRAPADFPLDSQGGSDGEDSIERGELVSDSVWLTRTLGFGNVEEATWTLSETNVIDPEGKCFSSPVKSALPCVCYLSAPDFGYDGVLIENERILGLKTNWDDQIKGFDVLYFG